MIKSDLIEWLAEEHPSLSTAEAESAVNTTFQAIKDSVVSGEHVELRGFGSFTIKQHNPHVGRNPKTGEWVKVEAKRIPFFKPGKALREAGKKKS
ncbi:MAG: integration host factor subunit beta [Zetaproteobacteria bacterium]|nr:integration host factor subunit beta [Zetaproteobacteria bacterium]